MSIFKACDIRGLVGSEITGRTALAVGKAVGSIVRRRSPDDPSVAVGGDVRPSTPELMGALVDGLMQTGCKVTDLGILPTPAFYHGKKVLRAYAGVMVTASHNPAGFNGFKVMLGDSPVKPEDVQEIRDVVEGGVFAEGGGARTEADVLDDYRRFVIEQFGEPIAGGPKVVVDAGGGCMGDLAPAVLRDAGLAVEELYCDNPGTFPRHPNPALAEALVDLGDKVRQTGADMGVAYDLDGDRAVFVDENGRAVPNDDVIVMFVREVLPTIDNPLLVYDIKCSSIVAEAAEAVGGRAVMMPSGYAYIKRALIEGGAPLGGEVSGHFFFGQFGGDDSLYATLLLARIVAASGRSLSQLAAEIPRYFTTPDIRLPMSYDEAERSIRSIIEASVVPLITIDGVRADYGYGWALARPSVTEPLLTLRFEAKDGAKVEEIVRDFLRPTPDLLERTLCRLRQ